MLRARKPSPLDATGMSALKAMVSESQRFYRLAKLHLVPSSKDSEHHLYVNRGASKASDLDNNNALVTIHFHVYNKMVESNEKTQPSGLLDIRSRETSSETECATSLVSDLGLKMEDLRLTSYLRDPTSRRGSQVTLFSGLQLDGSRTCVLQRQSCLKTWSDDDKAGSDREKQRPPWSRVPQPTSPQSASTSSGQ